jgi:hypothetical protein
MARLQLSIFGVPLSGQWSMGERGQGPLPDLKIVLRLQ